MSTEETGMSWRVIVFLIVLVVLSFGAGSAAAQSNVGIVVEIEGNWILNGSRQLSQAEPLPASGVIRLQPSGSRSDRIIISDLRGNFLIGQNCAVDDCSRPITLPRQPRASSLWGVAYEEVMKMIWGSPNRYSKHSTRSNDISEGLAKLENGKIDLASVMGNRGKQYISWRRISPNKSETADWSETIMMDSDLTVSSSNFRPGLYEISLMRKFAGTYESTSSVWVLVVLPADYEKRQADFQKAQRLAQNWNDKFKSETVRMFLQAYLDYLSRASTKKPN